MRSVQKLCIASVSALAAVVGFVKPLTLLAATSDVPPANSAPGTPGYPAGSQGGEAMQGKAVPGISTPSAPATDKRTDSEITMKVRSELRATKDADTSGIKVTTKNGVVHLAGKVKSDNDRLTALNRTRSVPGVSSVEDEMQIAK